jgi:hypothetical protein
MSADSSLDVQSGVYTLLTATSALTALLAGGAGGILDHVPPETDFPYVVLGETHCVPVDGQCFSGNDVTLTLHTYSRGAGMRETRSIMAAVYEALHNADFAVPSQVLVLCRCLESETRLEDDGLTRHGLQRFQIITEPA